MTEPTTAADRREMRERAEAAQADLAARGLHVEPLDVDPSRLLALLDEHEAQAAAIERLRERLDATVLAQEKVDAAVENATKVLRLREERDADRAAVKQLVDALPRCEAREGCGGTAQLGVWDSPHGDAGDGYLCDAHRVDDAEDVDWAAPLRALQARMAGWGEEGAAAPPAPEAAARGPLADVLTAAAEQVAKWPEWKRSDDVKRRQGEFDERMARLGLRGKAGDAGNDPSVAAARKSYLDSLRDSDAIIPPPAMEASYDPATKRLHVLVPMDFTRPPAPTDPNDEDEPSVYDAEAAGRGR